jgi:hypothetical protein
MTKEEFYQLHEDTSNRCYAIMKQKNHDYTAGSDDPFANFRSSEVFGVPGEMGILMRMMDKMKRINTFINTGRLEVNESVIDAWEDIVNYAIIGKGMCLDRMRDEMPKEPTETHGIPGVFVESPDPSKGGGVYFPAENSMRREVGFTPPAPPLGNTHDNE